MDHNILVVEDEKGIREAIQIYLKNQGYRVFLAENGQEGLKIVKNETIHLAVVDIMMPVMDGITMTMEVRKEYDFPIIFLSAKSEDIDKITDLNIGADDYITKPFKMPILHRRIQAALRKSGKTADRAVYDDGYLKIDFDKMTAVKGEESLSMTPTEYRILRLLIANADRVMTKGLLLEKIWDQGGSFVDEHTVAVNINRLRKKIETPVRSYIKTLYGMGYQWKGGK